MSELRLVRGGEVYISVKEVEKIIDKNKLKSKTEHLILSAKSFNQLLQELKRKIRGEK